MGEIETLEIPGEALMNDRMWVGPREGQLIFISGACLTSLSAEVNSMGSLLLIATDEHDNRLVMTLGCEQARGLAAQLIDASREE